MELETPCEPPEPKKPRHGTDVQASGPSRVLSATDLFGSTVANLPDCEVALVPSRSALQMAAATPEASDGAAAPDEAAAPCPDDAEPVAADVKPPATEHSKFLIHEGAHHGDFLRFFQTPEPFKSTYAVGEKIGEGSFGKVFTATHKVSGYRRAVKRITKKSTRSEAHKNELSALLSLDHPHIVRLVEFFDEERFFYLVFELCEGPDLFDRIVSEPSRRMTEHDASVALRHMLKALQCCHAQFRGHYDIKPENFMYASPDMTELMMIDLGLSSGFNSHRTHKIKGTEAYLAPECWRGVYGPEADVWSCGVVLFVMLSGEPFLPTVTKERMKHETEVRELIAHRLSHAAKKFRFSEHAHDLLAAMLRHDRHARPTVREALNHPFNVSTSRRCFSNPDEPDVLEALRIRGSLVKIFRDVASEPMLKRVARLAMAHTRVASRPERLAFRMLDHHGYGELSISVLEEDLRSRGVHVPDDFNHLFKAMDLNRDGYISYLLFLSITLPPDALADLNLLRVVFRIFDRDRNGHISVAELAAVFDHPAHSVVVRDTLGEVCPEGKVSIEDFVYLMSEGVTAAPKGATEKR